jgi:DNA-binding Xre family transcriptional regulator
MDMFVFNLHLILFDRLISRSELARISGLSPSTITRILNNNVCTQVSSFKILKGLQMTMSEVLLYHNNLSKG